MPASGFSGRPQPALGPPADHRLVALAFDRWLCRKVKSPGGPLAVLSAAGPSRRSMQTDGRVGCHRPLRRTRSFPIPTFTCWPPSVGAAAARKRSTVGVVYNGLKPAASIENVIPQRVACLARRPMSLAFRPVGNAAAMVRQNVEDGTFSVFAEDGYAYLFSKAGKLLSVTSTGDDLAPARGANL